MSRERSVEIINRAGVRTLLLDDDGLQDANGELLVVRKQFMWPLLVGSLSTFMWINLSDNHAYRLAAVGTATTVVGGSGATVTVVYCPGCVAIASGTAQLTAAIDLTVTAPKRTAGTLIAPPNDLFPGDGLAILFAGTLTGLVGCLNFTLKRTR